MALDFGAYVAGGTMLGGLYDAYENRRRDRERRRIIEGTDYEADNAWAGASEDPLGREAQLSALRGFQAVGASRGWDAGGRAAFQEGQGRVLQHERSQREAAKSSAQMRGAYTGGQGLAADLAGQQAGANALAGYGAQATADARLRALQAMQAGAGLAGDIRGQDQAWAGRGMDAANAIATFNAGQRRAKAGDLTGTIRPSTIGTTTGYSLGNLVGYGMDPEGGRRRDRRE